MSLFQFDGVIHFRHENSKKIDIRMLNVSKSLRGHLKYEYETMTSYVM